jgi:hypothetical protein
MKIFTILSFIKVCCIFFASSIFAQVESLERPVSELTQRQIRFRAMEQRALELSEKLSKLSGTEPIELFDRNKSLEPVPSETDAQSSYDSLPGPLVEPLPIPVEEPVEEQPVQFKSEVTRVVATTQQRKGDYYFMPQLGISGASSVSVTYDDQNHQLFDDMDGEWGNSIGLNGGRRWDNWYLDISLSYQYQKYENPDFQDNAGSITTTPSYGVEESVALMFGGGYSIPVSTRLSHIGGVNLGGAWRKNNFNATIYYPPSWGILPLTLPVLSQSSVVFAYDFSLGLEYMFVNNFSGYVGYKFLGMTKNKNFGTSYQHLFELGVGANF